MNSLDDPKVREVLDRLHQAARGDVWRMAGKLPSLILPFLAGKGQSALMGAGWAKHLYFPVSQEQGRFLYLVARTLEAKRIVEFGTSFGVSTAYLAAAVKDNGGGQVIGSELEPNKQKQATENLREAGLAEFVEIRLGDAMETLSDLEEPIDMVFMDGWKDLYLPVLQLIQPKIRPGAVVVADNILQFKTTLKPYVDYMQCGTNGFQSVTLSIGGGMEYSLRVTAEHR